MEMTLNEALQKAIGAHKAGQVQEADRIYTAILQSHPRHPVASHNMGTLAVSIGKAKEALPFFKTAVESDPNSAQFWHSYIDSLIKLGRKFEASAALGQAKSNGIKGETINRLETRVVGLNVSERKSEFENQQIGASSEGSNIPPEKLRSLTNLYIQGLHQQAIDQAEKMLEQYPGSPILYNICGAANAGLGKFDVAIYNYEKAIKIKPDLVEGYYNMGTAQQDSGNLEAALVSFQKTLEVNPKVVEAHYSMGLILQSKGKLDSAIYSFREAVKINPNYADAYFNIGNILKEKGDLVSAIEAYGHAIRLNPGSAELYYNIGAAHQDNGNLKLAIRNFQKALDLKPDIAWAEFSLFQAITAYKSDIGFSHPYLDADKEIQKIEVRYQQLRKISDSEIEKIYSDCLHVVNEHEIELDWPLSQAYRSNATLDCRRHKKIFNRFNIIPEYCFGCYKVQIEPRTVLELIKLFIVFDNLDLENNNDRKCMVELRVGVEGFYKGLVYCSGLVEANKISEYLTLLVRDNIGEGIPVSVKRGCSEYPISYPQYKEINNQGPQMAYNEEWRSIEVKYDTEHPNHSSNKEKTQMPLGFGGLTLSDFFTMQNWLVYAKEIGDHSYETIISDPVYSNLIAQGVKARKSTQ